MTTAPASRLSRSTRGSRTGAGRLLLVGLAGLTLLASACGDDDADAAEVGGGGVVATTPTGDDAGTVTVRAVDFAFQSVPATVSPGTRFALDNTAATELHELVAFPIPAGETRSVAELVADDLEALLTSAPPAFVILDPPGDAEQIVAVGDGTLTTPGRYALICMIPTGVEPGVYLEAAAQSNGGPPQVEGGPPHIAHGMFGEVTVTG